MNFHDDRLEIIASEGKGHTILVREQVDIKDDCFGIRRLSPEF